MDEIISLVVANGLFAVLFCGLLVFELRDSRKREAKYTQTIRELSDRLKTVSAIKADTQEILEATRILKRGARSSVKTKTAGAECVKSGA